MIRIQSVLFFICLFLVAISITTFADAGSISPISRYGNWAVQSGCTSVSAHNSSASAPEGFWIGFWFSCDNGDYGIPKIHVSYQFGNSKSHSKSQVKFKLADNDLSSDSWVCEKNRCSPKDNDSAAKILEQLLANEGPLTVIITEKNTTAQATVDTTGINEAYQALLKHCR